MNEKNNLMPSSLDRHIKSADKDAFGHRHFAQGLRSLIESDHLKPPYSIGLLGGWGTGKSTIKELYINDLKNDAMKYDGGLTRSEKIHSITFNAWRFGGSDQDIKRALLRHVFLELGGDEENLQDRLFRQVSETDDQQKGWIEYTGEVLKAWAMPLPAFLLSLLLLLGLLILALCLIPLEDDLSKSILILALTGAYSYLFKQVKSPPVSAYRAVTRLTLPSTTAEQFEDLLLDQITKFKSGKCKAVNQQSGKNCERLVIFVDDLDRLSAEEMVVGIDAVRTFMEIPESRTPKNLGIVFVISCDEAKVADALAKGRGHGDLPGTVFTHTDARRYLDRIFQFRLEIPPFPRNDMRQYAISQLRGLPGISTDLLESEVPIEAIIDRMIYVDVQNPRNALQIVNAFAQSWWLAKKREIEELGTDRPGGLHEGSVTAHPIALGAISAIKVNFPDFYQDLQTDAALLHRFTDVIVRGKSIGEQPLSTQQLLYDRYYKKQDSENEEFRELRPQHRPLRQFLASLLGLRWPESLQSLVLLSEDPITRKFGSRSTEIYDAFVSGDTQGVLEGLGRQVDGNNFNKSEVLFIQQMSEELRHEGTHRRTNASRVIADLVDRVPADKAPLLLGSLCRELVDIPELRSQLGIDKIGRVLTVAHADDKRAVVSRLIGDVLVVDGDVRLRLESMEAPNLDEAVAYARSTVDLALPIRRDHGLEEDADRQLIEWLQVRIVNLNDKHYQVSFGELEEWMMNHEDHLLTAFQERYMDLLATEFETDTNHDFDVSVSICRARKVFNNLWAAGEETRGILWSNLIRYVALKLPLASQAAWEMMVEHINGPDSSDFSLFIAAFSGSIKNFMESDKSEYDSESALTALLTLIRTRIDDIESDACSDLANLAIHFSQSEENATASCDLVRELNRSKVADVQVIFENWIGRIVDDLPIVCTELVGNSFNVLDLALQAQIISQLQVFISNDNIAKNQSNRYKAFISSLSEDAWKVDSLKAHLDSILPQLAARHNNPNNYLYRVFPVVAKVLRFASPGALGKAIHDLFSNAKGQPNHYAWLHSWMADRWPVSSKELNPYNPVQIFDDGQNFAKTNPQASSEGLLNSLCDMLVRKLVPDNKRGSLIEAACDTWSAKPEEASSIFLKGYCDLTTTQAANLVDSVDLANKEQMDVLIDVWGCVAKDMTLEDRATVITFILEKGMLGSEAEPDLVLRTWFNLQDKGMSDLLNSIVIQPNLNDLHRKRVWQQSVGFGGELGSSYFLDVIPKILVLPSIDETAFSVFGNYDKVCDILKTTEERADLAQRLMGVFTDVATNTVKSSIADWCKNLSGDASLRYLAIDKITDEDVDILKSRYSGSSQLKKILKKKI